MERKKPDIVCVTSKIWPIDANVAKCKWIGLAAAGNRSTRDFPIANCPLPRAKGQQRAACSEVRSHSMMDVIMRLVMTSPTCCCSLTAQLLLSNFFIFCVLPLSPSRVLHRLGKLAHDLRLSLEMNFAFSQAPGTTPCGCGMVVGG